jgi:hypothetical protein
MRVLLSLCLLLLLTSCGYRFGRGELIEKYNSVCIPYVAGDNEGYLTTELIRAITTSGGLAYRSYGSDLVLKVCLLPPLDTNIGFAYAPEDEEDDDDSDIVVSNEARLAMTASYTLIDRRTGECILGPCEATSSLTYDFEPDLSNVDFHAFSLGQLEMHNLALDAAATRLYRILAEKIVECVNHCW